MAQNKGWPEPPKEDVSGNRIFAAACTIGGILLGAFLIGFSPYFFLLGAGSRGSSHASTQWMLADTMDAFLIRFVIGSVVGGVSGLYYALKTIRRK